MEEISDSITQAVIKSQMPAKIRTHLELQTFTRIAELTSLMSSLSKMRTATTGSNAGAIGPTPMKIGWVKNKGKGKGKGKETEKEKGKSKGKKDEQNTTRFEGWCNNCGKWDHKAANCWHGKEKQVHQIQGGAAAATASSSSSQKTEKKTDEGAKEIALIESVQKDTERGWLFMIAEAMTINQLSWDGAHSLVVESGAHVHVCPKSYASHAPLQSLPECWRGWDLRSASCKMLKVWESVRRHTMLKIRMGRSSQ